LLSKVTQYAAKLIILLIGLSMTNHSVAAKLESATFAGGCFWCMQAPFDIDGVISNVVGYTGGTLKDPSYEQVTSGKTGHAEAIQIVFDPAKVQYKTLLDIFWHNVDPTVENRQFCDVGNQYRAEIFFHNEEQRRLAEISKAKLAEYFAKVFVAITPVGAFYPAEDYHQFFYKKNPLKYKYYRFTCGRDSRLKQIWQQVDIL